MFTSLVFILNRNVFSLIALVRSWVRSELFALVSLLCRLSGKCLGGFPWRLNRSAGFIFWLVFFRSVIVCCFDRRTFYFAFSFLSGLSFV